MTIREFDETIETFWDLKNFCEDNGYEYFTENIVDEYTMDSIIIDKVRTILDLWNWEEIRDYLDDIPEGGDGDYYELHDNGSDDITIFDNDDFEYLRREVREQLEMDGFFDEDDEEDAVVEEEEEVVEDLEISINDMILASIA